MKKLISVFLVAVSLFTIAGVFVSCSNKEEVAPSFEENIVGTWESQKDGSKNKATITFETKDGELKGNQRFYDYDNSEWGEMSFAVGDRTKYTITLLFDDGTMKTVSYSMGKNTLVFDNVIYINDSKNIPVDAEVETYMIDGVPMPVRAGVFFGMGRSEVRMMADTKFVEKSTLTWEDTDEYELPDFFYPQVDGYAYYSFDDADRLSAHGFHFYTYSSKDNHKLPELKSNLISAYSKQYGSYFTYEWTTSDTVSYIWETGNMSVELIVYDTDSMVLEYSLEDLSHKKNASN